MRALKKRFDHVTELRDFAREVEALGGEGAVALSRRMQVRAREVMAAEDPVAKGRIDPNSIFKSPSGAPVGRVEVRKDRTRRSGTLGLKAA